MKNARNKMGKPILASAAETKGSTKSKIKSKTVASESKESPTALYNVTELHSFTREYYDSLVDVMELRMQRRRCIRLRISPVKKRLPGSDLLLSGASGNAPICI